MSWWETTEVWIGDVTRDDHSFVFATIDTRPTITDLHMRKSILLTVQAAERPTGDSGSVVSHFSEEFYIWSSYGGSWAWVELSPFFGRTCATHQNTQQCHVPRSRWERDASEPRGDECNTTDSGSKERCRRWSDDKPYGGGRSIQDRQAIQTLAKIPGSTQGFDIVHVNSAYVLDTRKLQGLERTVRAAGDHKWSTGTSLEPGCEGTREDVPASQYDTTTIFADSTSRQRGNGWSMRWRTIPAERRARSAWIEES